MTRYRTLLLSLLLGVAARSAIASEWLRLEIAPAQIVLHGREARQRVCVTGIRQDGARVDLTEVATVESANRQVGRMEKGVALPVREGTTRLLARYEGLQTSVPLTAQNLRTPFRWSFQNHVEAVLSKQGCNQGTCHGGANGKGGFRLSLRAYSPEQDYEWLRYAGRGRRLSLAAPTQSLLLRKPTLSLSHVGGQQLRPGSLEYRVLREWIAEGAVGPQPETPELVRLEVFPADRTLLPKATQRLLVTAHFADGHTEDVTHWAKYTSNDEGIAQVDRQGRVQLKGYGETAIAIWYLGQVNFARLRVPFPNRVDATAYRSLPRKSLVDAPIYSKLAALRLWPSVPCDDATFLRRTMLDLIGLLPTPEELRRFQADTSPDKRAALVTALMRRPEYVDYWTYQWCDLLRVGRDTLGKTGMTQLYQWVRQSVQENRPWNRFVQELLTAQGSSHKNGAANFYRIGSRPEEYAETVSQAFLGIRVQCAHCHNHPHERWTQSDYYRMANFFARVERKRNEKDKDNPDGEEQVSVAAKGEVSHPRLGRPLPPTPFGGPTLALDAPGDRRLFLAQWLTAPNNPFFARSIVNRVWRHLMGRGLIEPVDDLRATNPASNESLLTALTQDFVARGYDIQHLQRTIVLSAAYQRTTLPNATNRADDRFYSRFLSRRLPAETLLDVIAQVTGQPETFAEMPAGTRARALPDTKTPSTFLDLFGRPARQITCECERGTDTSVVQALHLINAPTLNGRLLAKGGLIDRLLDAALSDSERLETLYLTCLTRPPQPTERQVALDALQQAGTDRTNRAQVFGDLLWAMLSGPEFLFNH